MKQATAATASVLSDRFLQALRLPESSGSSAGEDEWHRVSGALRLLLATSALKRSWDARKESIFAVAVGTATPVLETASLAAEAPVIRISQFLKTVQEGKLEDAAVVWELVRDGNLTTRVVSEFESLDSSHDFQNLVDAVHRVVFDCMFNGIKERFASFSARDLWTGDGTDGDMSMVGFSSSPLGYATEVADYLMTIPQQLEPFVPDEEDVRHATPRSPFVFSRMGAVRDVSRKTQNSGDTTAEADEGETEDDMANMSFAGMWISVLAIGTMELYVEKMCAVTRLSEAGARQLATDADYVCNVIASLGVNATREMELVRRLLECRGDASAFMQAAEGADDSELRKVARKVAAMRGMSVTL